MSHLEASNLNEHWGRLSEEVRECKLQTTRIKEHFGTLSIGIPKKWNPRPEAWDPTHRWDPGRETRDLKGGIRDPRHLFCMWPKTRDATH